MLGLLGSALAGGAAGAAGTDLANTAEENKQAEAMNLQSQRAAVEAMYAQRAEERHVGYGIAARKLQTDTVNDMADKDLASQGLLANADSESDQPVATYQQKMQAQSLAEVRAGYNHDDVLKEYTKATSDADKTDAMLKAWQTRAIMQNEGTHYRTDNAAGNNPNKPSELAKNAAIVQRSISASQQIIEHARSDFSIPQDKKDSIISAAQLDVDRQKANLAFIQREQGLPVDSTPPVQSNIPAPVSFSSLGK